jgi:hypothetical protein
LLRVAISVEDNGPTGSSRQATQLQNFLFHFFCNSGWLMTKRDAQHLPLGGEGGFSPWPASKASAIRRMSMTWGGKPR